MYGYSFMCHTVFVTRIRASTCGAYVHVYALCVLFLPMYVSVSIKKYVCSACHNKHVYIYGLWVRLICSTSRSAPCL